MLPNPLLTADQVTLLEEDNVVSADAEKTARTLSGLGIQSQSTAAVLPSYLWQYRTAGQFTRKTET
jgi:NADH dehydrogenase